MKFIQTILRFAGFLGPDLSVTPSTSPTVLPPLHFDHPASIQFFSWLSAFNTLNESIIREYYAGPVLHVRASAENEHFHNVNRDLMFMNFTGGLDIADVEDSSDPETIEVILKEKGSPEHEQPPLGRYLKACMTVDISDPLYPATGLHLQHIVTPLRFIPLDDPRRPQYEKALTPLNTTTRRKIIGSFVELLQQHYVYPETTETLVAALIGHDVRGDYENITQSEELARHLTRDLHTADPDLGNQNLGVHFFEHLVDFEGNITDEDIDHPKPMKLLQFMREINFGFGSVSWDLNTAPGKTIATLPINNFLFTDPKFVEDWRAIQQNMGNILSYVVSADALIIDLRNNHGGSPETVAFMLSYLLDTKGGHMHLSSSVDRNGQVDKKFSTICLDCFPPFTHPFGGKKPLFVLTSNNTMAAGEEMAYNIQVFGRGKVIGQGAEKTYGLTSMWSKPRFMCEEIFGKGWWMAMIPDRRFIHALTGKSWEGVGVRSDVVAGRGEWDGVEDAEEVGRRMAGKLLLPQNEL
jgi:hypothetical protein